MAHRKNTKSQAPRQPGIATKAAADASVCDFLSRSVFYWPLLASLLAVCAALLIFPVGRGEEDIWWHLKTGEWIFANKAVPKRDLFTYTAPAGMRWIDTQWFFQAVAAALHRIAEWNGLIAYRVIGGVALCVVAWKWLGELGYAAIFRFIPILIVILASYFRLNVRPELPTFSLLALQLWLYDRAATKGNAVMIPLIASQWFWGNWHSSCILGLILAALFCATELWRMRSAGMNPSIPLRALLLLPALMITVTLLNPNGWNSPLYALTESRKSYVLEFQPPDPLVFVGCAGLMLIMAALGYRKAMFNGSFFRIIVIVLFAIQSARMLRFLPYLAVVTVPLQAEGWRVLLSRIAFRSRLLQWGAVAAVIAVVAGAAVLSFNLEPRNLLRGGLDKRLVPIAAADFVEREDIRGNLFNEFENGGYLLWRFAPVRKVFLFAETSLNGRLEDRIVQTGRPEEWRKLFADFNINYAVINCSQRPLLLGGESLAQMMFRSWPDWKLVFWDDVGMVFVKDVPEFRDLIARRACRVFPEPIAYRNNPLSNPGAVAAMLENRNDWPAMEQELERVIAESQFHFRAAFLLGNLRDVRQDEPARRLDAFQRAEKIDPDSPELQQVMGRWHYFYGDADQAIAYTKKAMRSGADVPGVWCLLAAAQVKAGRSDEARKNVRKVLSAEPGNAWALKLKQQLGM